MQTYSQAQMRLLRRYMDRTGRLASLGGAALAAVWRELGSLDETDIATLRTSGAAAVEVFSVEASALTSGYLAALLDEPVVTVSTAAVEPDWRGPFIRGWAALGHGATVNEALAVGESQAAAVAANAIVSTARRASDQIESDRIVGWRRVLDADPCDWCVTVAAQTYTSAAAADFGHDRCGCGVTPILR